MQRWRTWVDQRAVEYRQQIRRGEVRDLAVGTMRPALHLTTVEDLFLRGMNPELDQPDAQLRSKAWLQFIASSDSDPYKVQGNI
jgi:hypothetical protein